MNIPWHLQPIFESYALVLGVAAALLALTWWTLRDLKVGGRQKRWLRILRLAWILGLLLLMLRPTLVLDRQEHEQRTVAVMIDQTLSMTTTDVDGRSRWEAVHALMRRVWPDMEKLGRDLRFDFYRFDGKARAVEAESANQLTRQPPTGEETDLGTSLQEVIQQQAGSQLAAVFILSDGAQRVAQPKIEMFDAARQLDRLGIPLYTIPFGQATDPTEARDVALLELPDQYRVFAKTEWTFGGQVEIQGYANRTLPVKAILESAQGERIVLPTQEVTATPETPTVGYQFTYVPEVPGQYKLTVSVPHQPGEAVTDNNQLTSYLTVMEGGIRVLQIESNWIGPEYKFRRRAIGSSAALEVDELLIDWRRKWPQALEGDVDLSKYDVFILGDVHAQALSPQVWQAIAQRVYQGAGLIMTGGVHSFGAGGFAETLMNEVLPVVMNRLERQEPDPKAAPPADLQLSGDVRMLPQSDHFVVRLGVGERNQAAWDALPPLAGAYRFGQLKPKGIPLAVTPDKQPLLVAGQFGTGRVLAFAGDSTYRWWLHGQADQHQRFWRQVVLWLANKEDLSRNELQLRLDRRRVVAGTDLGLMVMVRDEGGQAIAEAEVKLEMKQPDGQRVPVRLRRTKDGWAAELKQLTAVGDYELLASATVAGDTMTETSPFVVFRQDWERLDPAANPDQLRRLAEVTRSQGGRLLANEEWSQILADIASRPPAETAGLQRRWQFGDTWWDSLLGFTAIATALSVEWYLRKKWGLV